MSGTLATLAALLLIAALITIHEFGHFLVAKACGVHVRVFSIGIGGRMVGFKWRGTDYRISWFPFGGYVRMAGADPFMEGGADDVEGWTPGSFMSKPPWQRLLIVLAGPVMNLVLPVFVFTALMVAGEPQYRADIGSVRNGGPAEAAGVQTGDRIVEVEGTPVATWDDVSDAVAGLEGPLDLVVERADGRHPVQLPAVEGLDIRRGTDVLGFALRAPDSTLVVDDPSSPAGRAGLLSGDRIVSIDGQAVERWEEVRTIASTASASLAIEVARGKDETPVTVTLTPDPWAPEPRSADDESWRRWGLASAMVAIDSFSEDSAAAAAGLRAGDRILEIDGVVVRQWADVEAGVASAGTGEGAETEVRPLRMVVRRDGAVHTYEVVPKVVRLTDNQGRYRWRPLLGIVGAAGSVPPPLIPRAYPLPEAAVRATRETVYIGGAMLEQIGKMVTNEADIRDNLGGPVEIFRQTRAAAKRGIFDGARHMALFSISIGIINLLPIPVLDGGQLVIYLAEWVRGRPLPLVLRERAQQAGVIFLVLLMLFVLVNDIHRAAFG